VPAPGPPPLTLYLTWMEVMLIDQFIVASSAACCMRGEAPFSHDTRKDSLP